MKKEKYDVNCGGIKPEPILKEEEKVTEKVTKNDITDLVYIIDKSGSMHGLEKDTIGSFNSGLKKQREEAGTALVTTALFSTGYDLIHNRVDLNAVKDLDEKTYQVGGCTALLDAIGMTIDHLDKENNAIKNEFVPGKTIVVIITDGLENASREYSKAKVKEMIEDKKEAGWQFIFLGANFDAISAARDISIDSDFAARFVCDEKGLAVQADCLNEAIRVYRNSGKVDASWKRRIEDDYNNRK